MLKTVDKKTTLFVQAAFPCNFKVYRNASLKINEAHRFKRLVYSHVYTSIVQYKDHKFSSSGETQNSVGKQGTFMAFK